MGKIVKSTLFGAEGDFRFEENGMVIDSCELLKLDIVDPGIVAVSDWRPERSDRPAPVDVAIYGAVGRKA